MRLLEVTLVVAILFGCGLALPNPCVPECLAGTKCYLNKCVPLDQLPKVCSINADCGGVPYICNAGQCEYSPAQSYLPPVLPPAPKICNKLCIIGFHCQNGECVSDNKCALIDCQPDKICVNGACVLPKPCTKLCIKGYHCFNGDCVQDAPLPQCQLSTDCKSGQQCVNGECKVLPPRPKICNKLCMIGFHCENGDCVPNTKCPFIDCQPDEKCVDEVCVKSLPRKCTAGCLDTEKCVQGLCVPTPTVIDKCAAIKCKPGFECISGLCVKQLDTIPVIPSCKANDDCADEEACKEGKCVYNCQLAKCGGGTICLHGSCGLPYVKCITDNECGDGQKCHKLGKCVNKCSGVTCPSGKVCVQGVCQNQKCGKVECPKGTYCKKGKCVPDIEICPVNSKQNVKVCTEPRPNDVTCPQIFYIRAPDPAFCGVTADGTRINFAQECTTCKDKSIVYYFKAPCHKVPYVCEPSGTCNDYYCISRCLKDETCPYDWQICVDGKCLDRCASIRCIKGPCKFGQCGFEEPSGTCTLGPNSGCKEGLECIGFECADPCLTKACPPYQKCFKGECVRDVPSINS